jgi:U-box domain
VLLAFCIAGNKRTFAAITQVLRQRGLIPEAEIDALEALGDAVALAAVEVAQVEDDEDAPEEFRDALMCHIMADPVLLPTSNNVLDRCGARSVIDR